MFEMYEFDGEALVKCGVRKLDHTKIDWHSKPHSGSSMVKEGVYPDGTTKAQVEEKVRGTFGGGRFRYVAYTD